jgi:hypothetical protein
MTLYRGIYDFTEHQVIEQLDKNLYLLRLNNLNSFTDDFEKAWEFAAGPWLALGNGPREDGVILTGALDKTPESTELLADVLGSARAESLLRIAGFNQSGANVLMCLSRQPASPRGVMALASLGNIG